MKRTTKMLGDAGEHYAVARFTFAGLPATKMPDGWEGYDLAVETGSGLVRVSVKTRSETDGWKVSKWFQFDERRPCDWFAFVFLGADGAIRSWVVPFNVAREHANVPGPNRRDSHVREVSWAKLTTGKLKSYSENWELATLRPSKA